jgi:hypothetical protein
MGAWKQLAEMLGIETEAGWDALAKRRNMQRYGTQDRNMQQGPTSFFNDAGTGSAQRQATAAAMQPRMTPKPGGLQIPAGQDVPQPSINPLYGQPQAAVKPPPRGPLSRSANAPADDGEDDEKA